MTIDTAAIGDNAFTKPVITGAATGINPLERFAKSFADWGEEEPPTRRWIVDGLVPSGTVTYLSGDGGLGKSTLALQLQYSTALGGLWLGRQTVQVKSCALYCEDDEDEIHRRAYAVAGGLGIARGDPRLKAAQYHSRVGSENSLVDYGTSFDRVTGDRVESMKTNENYSDLLNWVSRCGAQLVILDSSHDFFVGNENNRPQVRYFISQLRVIAQEIDGAVLLLGHPSVAGMQSGTGTSGSTAWNNAVRSRLYLTRPKPDEAGGEDSDVRHLETKKANYTKSGGMMKIRWRDGVFIPFEEATDFVARIEANNRDKSVLGALRRAADQGNGVSLSKQAGNWVGRVLPDYLEGKGISPREIETIIRKMRASGEVIEQKIGQKADRKVLVSLTPKDWAYVEK